MSYNNNNSNRQNPIEQMEQQARQNPFGSGIYNQASQIEASLQSSPRTIILECNRFTSRQDDETAEAYQTNHRWITEFASGIEIKQGDEIRINSGYVSSIGVGDLIAWDRQDGSLTQDNLANWIFSVYVCNDGLNDKREGYNMFTTDGGGQGKFPYDTDNSACPLYRVVKEYDVSSTSRQFPPSYSLPTISYNQDPYLPCRFFGEKFQMKTPTLDNHFKFTLTPNYVNPTTGDVYGTTITCHRYTSLDTLVPISASCIFSLGQSYLFVPQKEMLISGNDDLYNHESQKWLFSCYGFNNNSDGLEVMNVDNMADRIKLYKAQTDVIQLTASVKVISLPSSCGNNEGLTPYSTKVYELDEENFIETEDVLYGYTFQGMEKNVLDFNNLDRTTIIDDNLSGNTPLRMSVSNSPYDSAKSKLPIVLESLYNPDATLSPMLRQQYIKFKNPRPVVISNLLELVEYIGSNVLVLNIYDPTNSPSYREVITCWIGDESLGTQPVNYEITNESIILYSVRRGCNKQQTNLSSDGQVISKNLIPDTTKSNYIVKVSNLQTDTEIRYSGKDVKQYQTISFDWGSNTTPLNNLGYFIFIKVANESLDNTTYRIFNDRTNSSTYQSSMINLVNINENNLVVNTPILYNGTQPITNNLTDNLIKVKHYQQFQFKINEDYSSPSDIATALTEQTHRLTNIRTKFGEPIPNSKATGLITNDMFFPVWGSNDATNVENGSKTLGGILLEGSFFLKHKLKDSSASYFDATKFASENLDGEIYFRTEYTTINKPTLSTETGISPVKYAYTLDFNQNGGGGVNPAIQFAKTFGEDGTTPVGFPIKFAHDKSSPPIDCLVSQYAGSNNVLITWDDTNSRFTLNYLHQPSISKFEATAEGIVQQGGEISSTIYYPAPIGKNNTLFKLPRTRCGGINIENWTSNFFTYPSTPSQVREIAQLANGVNLGDEWFNVKKTGIKRQQQENFDPISYRFWTKLGFSETQMFSSFVGFDYNDNEQYVPLGSTDNLTDVADGLITTKPPAENAPLYTTSEKWGGSDTTAREAKWEFGSIGALNFNNHYTGLGLPNTSGQPLSFRPNVDIPDPATTAPAFSEYQSSYNPDRERFNGYTFTTEGEALVAQSLPIKTEFPYFLVMSDIVKSDFMVSKNQGSSLNCVGVISKLNAEQDFYFQYQAPQSFYATKDTIINSITTELRTPNLTIPPALSPYSSILYQIVRYAPRPIMSNPPLFFQQEQFFNQMNTLIKTIANQNSNNRESSSQRFQDIMTEISSAVERPTAGTASIVQRIISNYDKLELSQFKNNPQKLKRFLLQNPQAEGFLDDIKAFNSIPSASTAGSNISEDTITDQLFSAPITSNVPADEETIDMGLGVEPPLPQELAPAPPPDQQDINNYLLRNLRFKTKEPEDFIDHIGLNLEASTGGERKPVDLSSFRYVDSRREGKGGSDISQETVAVDPIQRVEKLEDKDDETITDSGVQTASNITPSERTRTITERSRSEMSTSTIKNEETE